MEQAEYEREAIDWSYITFVDNQDVLDLIERPLGILDLLDEQCRFPRVRGRRPFGGHNHGLHNDVGVRPLGLITPSNIQHTALSGHIARL